MIFSFKSSLKYYCAGGFENRKPPVDAALKLGG